MSIANSAAIPFNSLINGRISPCKENLVFWSDRINDDGTLLLNKVGDYYKDYYLPFNGTNNVIDSDYTYSETTIFASRGNFRDLSNQMQGSAYGANTDFYWGILSGKWYLGFFDAHGSSTVDADTDKHTFVLYDARLWVLDYETNINTIEAILYIITNETPVIDLSGTYTVLPISTETIFFGGDGIYFYYSKFDARQYVIAESDGIVERNLKLVFGTLVDSVTGETYTVDGASIEFVSEAGNGYDAAIKANTKEFNGASTVAALIFEEDVLLNEFDLLIPYSLDNTTWQTWQTGDTPVAGMFEIDAENKTLKFGYDGVNYFDGFMSRILAYKDGSGYFLDFTMSDNSTTEEYNRADQSSFENKQYPFDNFHDEIVLNDNLMM